MEYNPNIKIGYFFIIGFHFIPCSLYTLHTFLKWWKVLSLKLVLIVIPFTSRPYNDKHFIVYIFSYLFVIINAAKTKYHRTLHVEYLKTVKFAAICNARLDVPGSIRCLLISMLREMAMCRTQRHFVNITDTLATYDRVIVSHSFVLLSRYELSL